MKFLVDTNVVSEWVKPRPNKGVVAWMTRLTRIASLSASSAWLSCTMESSGCLQALAGGVLMNG